jgi:two-component system response regulator PilR (NtrC family)
MTSYPTVLFVEDTESNARLLTVGLEYFNVTVNSVFRTGEKLLANLEHALVQAADVLIVDIRLPDMSGIELAARLRALGEERPLILVSAWPPPDQAELRRINALFVPKPFNFPRLAQILQQLSAAAPATPD